MKLLFWILIVFFTTGKALSQSDGKVLSASQIIKLIPDKVQEFHRSADSKSRVIKLGNIQYAIAEKTFARGRNRSIKILLFDYEEAPIMYDQATRTWSNFTVVETDSLILRPTSIKNCTGWESYNVYNEDSKIMLGICNRFFLTVEGKGVNLEFLKKVVQEFKFETYPR